MCVDISLPDGTRLGSLADIKAHGWEVRADDADDWSDELCLCGVDVDAILERNVARYHADWCGYIVDDLAAPAASEGGPE